MNWFARHRVLLVSAALVLLGAIVPYLIWGDALEAAFSVEGARAWMSGYGAGAGLAGIGLLVADLLLPIPSTLVMSALGLAYGTWLGGLYAAAGTMLAGLVAYTLVAVFVAGLMVGRSPEYLGKKIESREMKMGMIVLLVPPIVTLLGTALACVLPAEAAAAPNPGPHGFSELLYAFSSAGNNNGSAFGGLSATSPFWMLLLAATMLTTRLLTMLPLVAIGGSLEAKRTVAESPGTLPTHTPLFGLLVAGAVILVGALSFVPALALGPIAEALQPSAAGGGPR